MENIFVSIVKTEKGNWILWYEEIAPVEPTDKYFREEYPKHSRPLSNEEFEKFKAKVYEFDENKLSNDLHISQNEFDDLFA